MEIDDPRPLNEFGRLTQRAVKHARDAFVNDAALAAQWAGARTSRRRRTSRRMPTSTTRFLEIAHQLTAPTASSCPPDAAHDHRLDLRARRVARHTARHRALRDGQAARGPASQRRRAARSRRRAAGRAWPAPSSRPGCIEGGDVVWLDDRTRRRRPRLPHQRRGHPSVRRACSAMPSRSSRCRCRTGAAPGDVMHLMSLISPVDRDLARRLLASAARAVPRAAPRRAASRSSRPRTRNSTRWAPTCWRSRPAAA